MKNLQRKGLFPFLELVRVGLWGKDARLSQYDDVDYKEVYRFAKEQAVIGGIAAGMEYVSDTILPKEDVLAFVGFSLQLEQRNKAMDVFVAELIKELLGEGIHPILVKGQGIAQCYERPLWRASGDVDLLLDARDYEQAKAFLLPKATKVDIEDPYCMHLSLTIGDWEVELHGSLRSKLWRSIDRVTDEIQKNCFEKEETRVWHNGDVDICLPSPDNDVVFVFSHILQHFFREGIGLRQICDWCRLLWTYRTVIDRDLLEERIKAMGAMSEWMAFAALAVKHIGMPFEAMPLYSSSNMWSKKADKILSIIIENGSFGRNRDISYFTKYSFVVRKTISVWKHTMDSTKHFAIFPLDSIKAWWSMVLNGLWWIMKKSDNDPR